MKNKLLMTTAIVSAALFALPAMAGEAKIGDVVYDTLAEAIAATKNTSGKVIVLTENVAQGEGQFVGQNDNSNFTIDFDGKTYSAYKKSTGSTGTETQVFHMEKNNTIVLKNGTINVADPRDATGNFLMGLQNYSNLTLDNMVIDGSNIIGSGRYATSNNNASTTIKNSTIIAKSGDFAFDIWYKKSVYPDGVTVNLVDSNIKGDVEIGASSAGAPSAEEILSHAVLNVSGDNKISGTVKNNGGTINVKSGTLDISEGSITNKGVINFASGSNLLAKLDGSKVISGTTGTITGNTSLVLDTGADGKSLVLEGDKTAFNFDENSLYDINLDGDTYNIVKKSNEEISGDTGADANQAAAISAVIASGDTGNVAFDAVANTINEQLQSGDAAQVKAALDTITEISPEVAPVTQSVTTETTTQVFNAIGTRLSGGATAAANQGMSSGDSIFEKGAIWLQTLFNHAKLDDTSKTPGFKADTTGVALGIEKEINDEVKAGIGYAYNDSDIKSYLRKTDVDTHTAFVYGEYKPSDWFVNAMMSYNWSKYDEKTAVANAKYDVDSTALQAMTGYNLFYGNTTVTPEAGLRYIHIDQEAYRNSVGSRISGDKSDILTGVIGATVSQNVELENGSVIKPRARLAFTYDFKHDDSNSVVGLPNGSSYGVRGEALDRFGVETGLGLTAEINDEWEISADYEYRFRDDYRDHTGLLNFKYKF